MIHPRLVRASNASLTGPDHQLWVGLALALMGSKASGAAAAASAAAAAGGGGRRGSGPGAAGPADAVVSSTAGFRAQARAAPRAQQPAAHTWVLAAQVWWSVQVQMMAEVIKGAK